MNLLRGTKVQQKLHICKHSDVFRQIKCGFLKMSTNCPLLAPYLPLICPCGIHCFKNNSRWAFFAHLPVLFHSPSITLDDHLATITYVTVLSL